MMRSSWLVLVAAIGCASEPRIPVARYQNAPAVTAVDDRRDVPKQPHPRRMLLDYYGYNVAFERLVTRPLELRRQQRAQGVNALDEVPDSTWFTNRPTLTADQMRTGPVTIDNPELHVPWTVRSTGYSGSSNAFIITDARGIKYQLKFDDIDYPEVETGVDAVVDRLLWACGYNVPEDQVSYIRRQDLVLAPDAEIKGAFGQNLRKLDDRELERRLANVAHERDGRIRGITSRWIEGTSIGAFPVEGVRKDDPNDVIPHELRRDLRGMYAIYAWMDMVDIVPGNFLDTWTTDASMPNQHYVKHYAIDFGRSLGVMGSKYHDKRMGYSYAFDWSEIFSTIATLGLIQRRWETRMGAQDIRGVPALLEAKWFDPGRWKPELPFQPFGSADRFDNFWGAKIVAKLSRAQIRAAVEAGRYSDPRAVDFITDVLVSRQRKTAAYWYKRVAPLDTFEVADNLCFDDLAIQQGYDPAGSTKYLIATHDVIGRQIGQQFSFPAASSGHTCIVVPSLANAKDGYTVFEITTTRPDFRGATYVHVARDQAGTPRVIGVWRA